MANLIEVIYVQVTLRRLISWLLRQTEKDGATFIQSLIQLTVLCHAILVLKNALW